MKHHAVPFPVAVDALAFYIGWAGGWLPIERRRGDRVRLFWRPARAPGLSSLVRDLDERYSDEIAVGLPQRERWNGGVGTATVAWCWVEGSAQVDRAMRHRPLPTMALTFGGGSRRLLLWGLEAPVRWLELQAANKRLAYAFGARQRDGDPDGLRIPMPGTCLRAGRSRPAPVVCSRLTVATFDLAAVAGHLREPPEPAKWWEGRPGARAVR